MSPTRTRSRALLLASLIVWLAGCIPKEEDSTGTLVVPFELGNGRDCDEFGVVRVRGELDEGEYVDEVRCESGEVRFDNVPAGTYSLRLFGLDHDDVAVMDTLEDDDLKMNVIGDDATVIAGRPVQLTSAPAHMYLRWTFGFGTCKNAGITSFLIDVWRGDGSDLLLSEELDCEEVGDDEGNYREVPDPHRALSGDEVGEAIVQPVDHHGSDVGEEVLFDFKAPGPGRDIRLSLDCSEEPCTGTIDYNWKPDDSDAGSGSKPGSGTDSGCGAGTGSGGSDSDCGTATKHAKPGTP